MKGSWWSCQSREIGQLVRPPRDPVPQVDCCADGVCQDTSAGIGKRPPGPTLFVRPVGAVRHMGKVKPVAGQGSAVTGATVCGEPFTVEFDVSALVHTRLLCKVHRVFSYGFLEKLLPNTVPIPPVLSPVKLAEWAASTPLPRRPSSARKGTVSTFTGRANCTFWGKGRQRLAAGHLDSHLNFMLSGAAFLTLCGPRT